MNRNIIIYFLTMLILQASVLESSGITAKFSYIRLNNCAPSVVSFTNESTQGKGIIYTWNFGLGSSNTTTSYSSQEQVYATAGQYTVSLTVTDGTNTDVTSTVIKIYEGPTASFTTDKLNGCPSLTVNFNSTSKEGESVITSTFWDFRTGDTKEGTSVQYTYNDIGLYDLVLKVTDSNGCTSTNESDKLINVTAKPSVNFSASDTFACSAPLNVTFRNLSSGSTQLSYYWDFGNGSTSDELSTSSTYSSSGSYDVKLKVRDQTGCSDSLIRKSYINVGYTKGTLSVFDLKGNSITKTYLCDGTYRFVYSSSALPDYIWKITDNGTTKTVMGNDTLTYKVSGSGTLSVKLVYGKSSYCTDSVSVSFTKSYIKASFSMNDTLFCSVPSRVIFTNNSENAMGYSWFLSDKHLSDSKDTSYIITQNNLPDLTYKQTYSHQINTIRLPVMLVVTNNGGCADTVTNAVIIALPVARFVPDKVSGCVPLKVILSDSSKCSFKIDSYTYKTGNDSITTSDNSPVSYTFTKPGVYNVTETIRSGNCNDISEVIKIVAGDKLTPDFNISPVEVCNGGRVRLTATVNNSTSKVNLWRFKSSNLFDLSFHSAPDTTFNIYSDTLGYRNISLQADYNGCLSSVTKTNSLKIIGSAGTFTQSFNCDSSYNYHFKSVISPATSLTWNIDTATYPNVDEVNYKFPKSGDYSVKLTASDASTGCQLIRSKNIKVRKVSALFTLNDSIFCAGDTVSLNASSSTDYIKTCYNEGFLWNFGDDSPPRRTFQTGYDHIYTSRGTDTITLVVTADNGCTDTISKVVRVYKPAGSFKTDKTSGCVPEMNIQFTNTSTDSTIISWVWNFGDKSSDSTKSTTINHTYTGSGQKTFYPSLMVYDSHQCSGSYSVPVQLIGINNNFQADDNAICVGGTVTFTPVDTTLTNFYWDFGDGTSSSGTNKHTYSSAGKYTVSLTASKESCRDTITRKDYISVEQANASFIASDTVFYCYPDTVSFVHINSTGSTAVEYTWTFDNNVLSDKSSDSVNYVFTKPGVHMAYLTVKTLNGCTAGSSKRITVSGPDAVVSFTPDRICYNGQVNFSIDSIINANTWKLYFGDGSSTTQNPATHNYTSRGKIVPYIQLANGSCNTVLSLDTLYVADVRADFTTSDSIYTKCLGNKLNFLNRSKYSSAWSWAVDSVEKSTYFNYQDVIFNSTGNYYIRLIARDVSGCADTLQKTVTIVSEPESVISGDTVLCTGSKYVTLSVIQNTGETIKWTPSEGLSNTSSFNIQAAPAVTTTYTATVTNSSGCSSSHTKTIEVNNIPDFTRSPAGDTTIYLGEKVQLIILTSASNVNYSWSPAENITCTICNNPWVSPEKTTIYSVVLTDNCFNVTEKFNVNVINDFYLEAPSAFTPNGDSNNELFRFEEKNIAGFELKIFNRWGEIVYSSNDVTKGWDGTVNGHVQNIDTYIYTVKAVTVHGYKFEKKGEFLLLK